MNELPAEYGRVDIDALAGEYTGVFNRETIERYVLDSIEQLERSSKVTQFLPLLVERFTRERLQGLVHYSGLKRKSRPSVLFMCVHNAGRSQIAAAFLRSLGDGRVESHSAGSAPGSLIHANVVEAMAELGIDLREEFPKPVTDEVVGDADVVVTMGCGDACPVLPGKRYLDWQVDDPADKPLAEVRIIRDDIRQRVASLIAELTVAV